MLFSPTILWHFIQTASKLPRRSSFAYVCPCALGITVAMRLLHFDSSGKLASTNFIGRVIPPYAILSHTWGDDEFLFEDLVNGTGKSKAGYEKILFCNRQAARDHLQYFWIDTCCIDKWNLRELSNAINSMFSWYRRAAKCYVFLSDVSMPKRQSTWKRARDSILRWFRKARKSRGADVPTSTEMLDAHENTWETSFRNSRWFTRGWTLQELLAPASVEFFSLENQRIGDKESLEQQIHEITGIPVEALRGDSLEDFSVKERQAWMAGRQTMEEEDMAYSLIGIIGVSMEFRYGEGKERALSRLEESIEKVNTTPFIVPFNQNTRFVGRDSQLAELKAKLFVGSSTTKVAITGPGGVGKTQLALELAYRVKQEYKNCSIFWIPANDVESINQEYTTIARRLSIPGWDNGQADAKRLVQHHLSQESTGRWLLIFDNADDGVEENADGAGQGAPGSFEAASLVEYLPSSEQGAIIFTTTNKTTAVTLAPQNIFELTKTDQDMAQRMLETYMTDPPSEQGDMSLLVQELGYLPLAIVQAAAYININNIRPNDYLLLLANKKIEMVECATEDLDDGWQCRSSGNPISTTWLISFEQISRRNTLAAEYMFFMACIDRKDIPMALLPAALPHKQMDAVGMLDAYSFITKRPADLALELHRLVHLATRTWLQNQDLLSQRTQEAISRLTEVFPEDDEVNRSKWRRLLPHVKYILSCNVAGRENDKARLDLVDMYARALWRDGRFSEAEAYFYELTENLRGILGEEHPDILITMAHLATSVWSLGRYKDAEELDVRVLELSKKILGEKNPTTLARMHNLAMTYSGQGRWKEAEELEVRVIKARKRLLGKEHLETLLSMGGLAYFLTEQGRYKEAEELGVQVVEKMKRVMGEEHPSTLTTMANLAVTYNKQSRIKEAEELETKVLEARMRVLGREHPQTLKVMNNLACTWKACGRDADARALMAECVRLKRLTLGESNPDTFISIMTINSWAEE